MAFFFFFNIIKLFIYDFHLQLIISFKHFILQNIIVSSVSLYRELMDFFYDITRLIVYISHGFYVRILLRPINWPADDTLNSRPHCMEIVMCVLFKSWATDRRFAEGDQMCLFQKHICGSI